MRANRSATFENTRRQSSDFPSFVVAILAMVATFVGIWSFYYVGDHFLDITHARKLAMEMRPLARSLSRRDDVRVLHVQVTRGDNKSITVRGTVLNRGALKAVRTRLRRLRQVRCDVVWEIDVEQETDSERRLSRLYDAVEFNRFEDEKGGVRWFAIIASLAAFVIVLKKSADNVT